MAFTLRSLSTEKVVKKVDGFKARLTDIQVVDGFNVRISDDDLREHIAAIAGAISAGLPIPPLEVWVDPDTGVMELVDGHCRYHAYHLYAETSTDFDGWVSVTKFEGTRAQRKARIVTSNNQLKLKPIELGRVYLSLRDEEGMSRYDIAAMIGRSVSHIDQLILLASASDAVTQAVESGAISATEAVKLQRDHGDDAPAELERRKEVAKELGKDRVTAKAARPGTRKEASYSARSVVECASALVGALPEEVMDLLGEGVWISKHATIPVNTLLLADLVDAVQSMQAEQKPLDADKQCDLLEGAD